MGEIIMPKVGDAMTEGKVVRWYKKAGDAVKLGEPLLEIETDKVNLDLEAEEDGVLGDLEAEPGAVVEVGGRLALVRVEGEEAPAARPAKKNVEAPPPAEQQSRKKEDQATERPRPRAVPDPEVDSDARGSTPSERATEESSQKGTPGTGRSRSSPLARRMALELGVELASVHGSGPGGRIVASDIEQAAASDQKEKSASPSGPHSKTVRTLVTPAALEEKRIPLSAMRRTIARRLAESIGPIPHFFLTIEADVTSLLQLRQQLNEIQQVKTSVNDFVTRAAALALLHHPMVNSSFTDEAILQHGEVHVGIAVATPEGLITPVIRNADQRSVPEIAAEARSLVEKARNRKLKPEDYQGSTFTISNLGMFGIEEFTAIINPPNSAILAVGAARPKPVVDGASVVVRDRMRVTMSCDHRVVDGAVGAQYLQTFQQYLEQPLRLLV
ncbi:MAG: dihydrolipoamide acetyltransferase family protein [Acidobacteriota bacterium]